MRLQRIIKPHFVLFEDGNFPDLYPLTRLRPAFDLRCGAYSLRERSSAIGCWLLAERQLVAEAVDCPQIDLRKISGPVVLLNGRGCLSDKDLRELERATGDTVWIEGQTIVAIQLASDDAIERLQKCDQPTAESLQLIAHNCKKEEVKDKLFHYLWDLVNRNGAMIAQDFTRFNDSGYRLNKITHLIHLIGKRDQIKVCKGAVIDPGVVLDTTNGPIIIDQGAHVRPLTLIEGPCYVGKNALIDGAKLRQNCSIGANCKIAGEVEDTVMLDYSNKHHDGFLGHAYVGSWVNLGAQTCNSDLKNNYGTIAVRIGNKTVDSGSVKVGCFIGDHSKTAIGTLMNTGAVIGIGCNVHGGAVRKSLPDFSWGHSERCIEHSLDKMLATAQAVMARRKQDLSGPLKMLITKTFEQTRQERIHAGREGAS